MLYNRNGVNEGEDLMNLGGNFGGFDGDFFFVKDWRKIFFNNSFINWTFNDFTSDVTSE